jgi:ribonuclease P protein component
LQCEGFFNGALLQQKLRYHFGKKDKLKSRKQIETLFSKGNRFSHYPFNILWLPNNKDAVLQTGVSVSSRNFKKAVDRNRIKRLMREAYRLQKNELNDLLVANAKQLSVFILYNGKELPEYELIFEKMGTLLKRLMKLNSANP